MALDEEIRKVQNLFIEAYKEWIIWKIKNKSLIKILKYAYYFSHLQEHVSNFSAVSTQVHVTLWKEDRLLLNKDKTYLMKLMRPEDS